MRLKRATGSLAPPRQGKPKGSVLDSHADFILGLIEARPDITLKEIAQRLAAERSVNVVTTAVWKFLDHRGGRLKKRPPTRILLRTWSLRQIRGGSHCIENSGPIRHSPLEPSFGEGSSRKRCAG